jgi:hypothetical protein
MAGPVPATHRLNPHKIDQSRSCSWATGTSPVVTMKLGRRSGRNTRPPPQFAGIRSTTAP